MSPMPRRPTHTQTPGTKRLGATLRKLRTERAIPATELVQQTGMSRSYLAYLESGRFAEVGLDKFTRLLRAMNLSADQVLEEAGYLPARKRTSPSVEDVLRDAYKLPQPKLQLALEFLEFLSHRQSRASRPRQGKRAK